MVPQLQPVVGTGLRCGTATAGIMIVGCLCHAAIAPCLPCSHATAAEAGSGRKDRGELPRRRQTSIVTRCYCCRHPSAVSIQPCCRAAGGVQPGCAVGHQRVRHRRLVRHGPPQRQERAAAGQVSGATLHTTKCAAQSLHVNHHLFLSATVGDSHAKVGATAALGRTPFPNKGAQVQVQVYIVHSTHRGFCPYPSPARPAPPRPAGSSASTPAPTACAATCTWPPSWPPTPGACCPAAWWRRARARCAAWAQSRCPSASCTGQPPTTNRCRCGPQGAAAGVPGGCARRGLLARTYAGGCAVCWSCNSCLHVRLACVSYAPMRHAQHDLAGCTGRAPRCCHRRCRSSARPQRLRLPTPSVLLSLHPS